MLTNFLGEILVAQISRTVADMDIKKWNLFSKSSRNLINLKVEHMMVLCLLRYTVFVKSTGKMRIITSLIPNNVGETNDSMLITPRERSSGLAE